MEYDSIIGPNCSYHPAHKIRPEPGYILKFDNQARPR